jgi:hypothetical protein
MKVHLYVHILNEEITMADRAAFEAAVVQLTALVPALTTAAQANAARFEQQITDLQTAVTNAANIVPDGDLTAIQAAITAIQTVVDALNVGTPAAA